MELRKILFALAALFSSQPIGSDEKMRIPHSGPGRTGDDSEQKRR